VKAEVEAWPPSLIFASTAAWLHNVSDMRVSTTWVLVGIETGSRSLRPGVPRRWVDGQVKI
jgi:hypothetical protein